jgi:hypothetical protein
VAPYRLWWAHRAPRKQGRRGATTARRTQATSWRPVLIPQGVRLIGEYDSSVVFGQNRVLLVWNRLILPTADRSHSSANLAATLRAMPVCRTRSTIIWAVSHAPHSAGGLGAGAA